MKKTFIAVIGLILALSLTACGSGNNNNSNTPSGNNSTPGNPADTNSGNNNVVGEDVEFNMDYINNNLPASYHIVYNITMHQNGETDGTTLEQIRTPEGFYFGQDEDDGMLFIKNGNNYDTYYGYDGEFENAGMAYTKDMVEAMMFGINGYMTTYTAFSSQLGKSVGSVTVAGRNCEKYTFKNSSVPGIGYKMDYTYYIDKATGVCLKVDMEIQGGGEKVGYEFEASKFETSGVSLPAYK